MGWRNVWYKICIFLVLLCGCYETSATTEITEQNSDLTWNVSNENRTFTLTDEQYQLLEDQGELIMLIRMTGKSSGSWVSSSIGSIAPLCATYYNGLHVIGGGGTNRIYTSPDTVTWTARTIGANVYDFAQSGSIIVAACWDGLLYSSDDAQTWTLRLDRSLRTTIGADAFYNGSTFQACWQRDWDEETYGVRAKSTDGTTWTYSENSGAGRGCGSDGTYYYHAWCSETYAGSGSWKAYWYRYDDWLPTTGAVLQLALATDEDNWFPQHFYQLNGYSIILNSVGNHLNYLYYRASPSDGWTGVVIGSGGINNVFFDERIQIGGAATWFICGNDGKVYYSHNLSSWTSISHSTTDDFHALYTDGATLFAVSYQGNLWRLVQ